MQRVCKAALFTLLNLEKMVQPCVSFPASLSDELGLVPVSRGFSCYLEARRYRLRLPAAYVPVCAPLRLLGRTHSTPQAAVWPNALFQLPSFSDAGVGCFLLGLLLACSLKGWEFETARDRFRPENDMKHFGFGWVVLLAFALALAFVFVLALGAFLVFFAAAGFAPSTPGSLLWPGSSRLASAAGPSWEGSATSSNSSGNSPGSASKVSAADARFMPDTHEAKRWLSSCLPTQPGLAVEQAARLSVSASCKGEPCGVKGKC